MAVAGLHNVLAYCPPFFGESQSPVPRTWGEEQPGQPSTRASSLLQMWREIEGEHVVCHSPRPRPRSSDVSDSDHLSTITSDGLMSDNGDDSSEDTSKIENHGRMVSENDYEDSNSVISEQSIDLGEIERERVRQIFREWMNSGAMSHSARMNKQSQPQWLADNECERVGIIREWVQKNTQQGSSSHRDGDAEIGSQFEEMCDGLAVNPSEVGAWRPIRRLCGRQTLLDLLLRAQEERRSELQGLSEQKPVSDFAHRNRIQALLRCRFLRNERLISDERPRSIASTELGMLSQRHAVSDLREGFLSRLDNSAQILMNSHNEHIDEHEVINGQSRPICKERDTTVILPAGDSERGTHENIIQQEFVIERTSEVVEPVLDNGETSQEASTEVEQAGSRHGIEINDTGTTTKNIANEQSLKIMDVDGCEHLEVFAESDEHRTELNYAHEVAGYSDNVELNANEEFDWEDSSAQVDRLRESVIENEESSWQQLTGVPFSEWTDDRGWQGNSANQWSQETSGNDSVEHGHMQESHEDSQGHDLQEAIGSWLDVPYGEDSASVERVGGFYFPDDDNVYSVELREVFSRRRVSSLLRSGFRESLNQVLQSHMERQAHASSDWELDNASSSLASTEQVEEQINGDHDLAQDGTERHPFVFSYPLGNALQPLLDEELQDANWPCNNSELRLGMEWEAINELRVDMARLQHRVDNMQRMLESCMDMQIELQRTLRQEVSAALNRSNLSTDKLEGTAHNDESQWNHVKNGICCLCHDSHIDSLLYRCGHICTCSRCAQKLVESTGQCPMCQAPVVEAVQAYFLYSNGYMKRVERFKLK